ncbi:ParA family protein [Pseudonocardia sp. N23]|uniref:ParA family protein n=1 Tax=Pseudonocardia sp. N23 TaxID=1987376 RepID=UPI001145730F|nr:ParA family protein [Pseudonocardia sp. N23]
MAMFKGGVGKSTSAVNVAAALARRGHRTLLVDCDPQANATEMFISEDEVEFDLRSIIAERVPVEKVIRETRVAGLDVLPASFDLAYLDKELVVSPAGVTRIGRALRDVRDDYSYVVFDTGPNLSHLTLGALAASEHIVIPVSATVWATTGLRKFVRWIDQHRDDEVLAAQLLGLVATMVQPRTRIGQALLDDLASSPFPTFRTWIPRRIAAEDAAMDHAVVGDLGMDRSLGLAYNDLTGELVTRVQELQTAARHAR